MDPRHCPIEHVVILCQENRSLDHYLGFMPGLPHPRPTAANQAPDARGRRFEPFHIEEQQSDGPSHHWDQAHAKWNGGAMDGFVSVDNGPPALGHYLERDHPYHAALAAAFSLSDQHFCPLIGPTTPNRSYLWTGTAGGWRQNPTRGSRNPRSQ